MSDDNKDEYKITLKDADHSSKRQKRNFEGISFPSINWNLLASSDEFQQNLGLKIQQRLNPINEDSYRCLQGMMDVFSLRENELVTVSQTKDTRGKPIEIRCGDLITLEGNRWLSSDVINILFRLLERREFRKFEISLQTSSSDPKPKFNLFPGSHWFEFLSAQTLEQMEFGVIHPKAVKVNGKFDRLISYDQEVNKMIFAVNTPNLHWALAVADWVNKTLFFYNSMPYTGRQLTDVSTAFKKFLTFLVSLKYYLCNLNYMCCIINNAEKV